MIKMEFVFSEEKALALGYTAQACYDAVDKVFAKYGITPIAQGVYEAPDNQNTFNAFGAAQFLPDNTSWFLKTIDRWNCYEDEENPDEYEDCLALHYKYAEINS